MNEKFTSVCIVGPSFDDPNRQYEGRTKMIARLYRFLKESGIPMSTNLKGCGLVHINSSGIFETLKYMRLPKERKIYSLYSNLKTSPKNVLRDAFDFIRIRNPSIKENSLIRIIIRTFLTLSACLIPWKLVRVLFEKTTKLVILPNRYTYNHIRPRNGKVIRLGIDIKKFENCPSRRIGGRNITIGYVGHPSTSKGIIEVLEIFSHFQNVRKVLFLSNPSRIKTELLKKIGGKVEIEGPQEDVPGMYSSIDVLILPYRHELSSIATPLVLLEAMACGVAIVTSDIGHLREAGGDSILYAKPGNIESFVEKVRYLLDNPKMRRKLGKKAKAIARRRYDEKSMLREYLKLYRLLGDGNEPGRR